MARKSDPISGLLKAVFSILRTLLRNATKQPPTPRARSAPTPASMAPYRPPKASTEPPHQWPELGEFAVEAVGESHYQLPLKIAHRQFQQVAESAFAVTLRLDDTNPHDRQAVALLIDENVCGYLSREDARAYRRRMRELNLGTRDAIVGGRTTGGFDLGHGEVASIGLILDLAPFDD